MARGSGQGAVAGEKRGIKSFRQGDVSSVICRDVAAQFPNAIEEWPVRVAFERDLGKRQERLPGALRRHLAGRLIASQSLRNFQVDEMWSMQRFEWIEQTVCDAFPG